MLTMMRRLAALAVAACACAGWAESVQAADFRWINAAGDWFEIPGNWELTSGTGTPPPGPADNVLFDLPNTYTVRWDATTGHRTNVNLTVSNGAVTFASFGAGAPFTYTLTNTTITGATLNLGISAGQSHILQNNALLNVSGGGTLNVGFGSVLTTGSAGIGTVPGEMGTAAVDGAASTVNLQGNGSKINQAGASQLELGAANSPGILNIGTTGGDLETSFTTGTGGIRINPTGAIHLAGGTAATRGRLNANGDVIIDGGILRANLFGFFNLAPNRTLSAFNGAEVSLFSYTIHRGTAFTIAGGSSLSTTGNLHIGTFNFSDGTLLVDGPGSTVSAGAEVALGGIGSTALLTLANGAAADFSTTGMNVARFGDGSIGTVSVLSGSTLDVGYVFVGDGGNSGQSGTIRVDGPGSTFTQTASGFLILGADAGSTGTLDVSNGGSFIGGGGGVTLNPTGTIRIDRGTVSLGAITRNGGTIDFISGSFGFDGDLAVAPGGFLGADLALPADKHLSLTGTMTIDPFHTLSISGGRLSTGGLIVNGLLDFQSGELAITGAGGLSIGAGGPLGSTLWVDRDQTINITHTATVQSDAALHLGDGVFNAGTLASQGLIIGGGRLGGTLENAGEIRAESGRTLRFDGSGNINSGQIRLLGGTVEFRQDLAQSSTGRILGRGTFIAEGGLANAGQIGLSGGFSDFFGPLSNTPGGQIIVSGGATASFYGDVVHDNGAVFRISAASMAVFFGNVSGSGSFTGSGTSYFEGTLSPGSSPGAVTFEGDVAFGPASTLIMEIAGTAPGTQHDQINVGGHLSLNGTLNVLLIDKFQPQGGQSFNLFNFGSLGGTFATINLPDLSGALSWDISALYSDGILSVSVPLLPGDANRDGRVDGEDFLIWQASFGTQSGATWDDADFNGDGRVDGEDFLIWQANFGRTASASGIVPEPAAGVWLIGAGLGMLHRRRSSGRGGS